MIFTSKSDKADLNVMRDWNCGYTPGQRSVAYEIVKPQCPGGMCEFLKLLISTKFLKRYQFKKI